jgi:primosomal protein N' (replication factor Y)
MGRKPRAAPRRFVPHAFRTGPIAAMASQQRTLFDDEPPPWEADDAAQVRQATVVFADGPVQSYDYRVPDALIDSVEPGRRLRVPLGRGNRVVVGYCVAVRWAPPPLRPLKDVLGVVDRRPLLSGPMLDLAHWLAERYVCPLGTVLEAVLPAGVRGDAGTRATRFLSVPDDVARRLDDLRLGPKQAHALRVLAQAAEPLEPRELARRAGCSLGPILALRQRGLLSEQSTRVARTQPPPPARATERNLTLGAEQRRALDAVLQALEAGVHRTLLLHGVTGSGKTEVYIQAIEHVLRMGRQAIVLVPEISLTPQTRQRFRARFGDVAVLHSHMSDAERHAHWERIARGEVSVVVGARSAVFAPTPQLGLIVLDEEHEASFKQATAPRYHAREVALYRARQAAIPLLLGSATPSLESWYRAQRGDYVLLEMPQRVHGRPLPHVQSVDLRTESLDRAARGAISRPLKLAMERVLARGEQVILLLNRRGYSTHIQCPACGTVLRCPNCDIALTHHRHGSLLLCHYCEYSEPSPAQCPQCQFAGIRYSGLGTQRLEAEVQARFPQYACLRMDTDAMQRPGSHEQALDRFRRGEVQILLGTQMIAKGLDFPNVTLVGVVNADTALHLPDFRAAERTFQLIVQVAGRSGRGPKGGRVLVQSFTPEHPAIRLAEAHDYAAFARYELEHRRALGYPPHGSLIRVVVRGPVEEHVRAAAEELATRLRAAADAPQTPVRLLGPAPAPLPKLRGLYRYHLQLQAADDELLRGCLRQATHDLRLPEPLQWMADVDPLDML